MNGKRLCRKENNANHEEDHCGIHLSQIQSLSLSSLPGSAPVDATWCPSLTLGSLFMAASDPQSMAVSFRFGWPPLFCPASFPAALGPVVVPLMTQEDCQCLFHLSPEGVSVAISGRELWVTPGVYYLVFSENGESVSPSPCHTSCCVPDSFQ